MFNPGCTNCGDGVPAVCAVCEKYSDDAVKALADTLNATQMDLAAEREKFTAMLANRDSWQGLYTAEREKRLAAEKDSARLDWVLSNRVVVIDGLAYGGCSWNTGRQVGCYTKPTHLGLSFIRRAVIDAAIEAEVKP